MIKKLTFVFAAVIAISASGSALAQATTDIMAKVPYSAYLQDSHGAVVRSGTGMCWRTGYWTPADAVLGCDGDLAPPVASLIAPPIAPESAPQAIPHPAPITPVAARCDFSFTLESDQTFGFNSAVLSASAKQRIDEQLHNKFASCAHVDKIIVSGYTDHLGTDQLNQSLSIRRAAAVSEYLVQSGVNAPIEQHGLGKRQELKLCKGIKLLKNLINCLAPNRRVEIEIKGVSR